MTRSSISVDTNISDEFSLQAQREGKTLYTFANEWLEAASRISSEGGTAEEIVGNWRIFSVLKQVDVITLPADFVEELIAHLYTVEKENLCKKFSKLGSDLVSFMKMAAPDIGQLTVLAQQFAGIIPTKRIDIKTEGDAILVDVVGAGRRIETTKCSFEFVKAVLIGYGYRLTSQEVGIGVVRIRGAKSGAKSEPASGSWGRPRLSEDAYRAEPQPALKRSPLPSPPCSQG